MSVEERLATFADEEIPSVLTELRVRVLAAVKSALPTKQQYFTDGPLPYVDSLKYIDEHGVLSYIGEGLKPHCMRLYQVDDLPLESLVDLYRLLVEARNRKPSDW